MASNVTTTQRAHALRLGRLKAAESGRARAESRRSRVESVLDQLEQAGELVANIEIARRAGVGKNYLRESAPDLAARARQVRSRLAGERAEQALAQQDELREQIISENDQLLGELQRRGERIHFLEMNSPRPERSPWQTAMVVLTAPRVPLLEIRTDSSVTGSVSLRQRTVASRWSGTPCDTSSPTSCVNFEKPSGALTRQPQPCSNPNGQCVAISPLTTNTRPR